MRRLLDNAQLLGGVFALVVLVLFVFQIRGALTSAGRTIGISYEESAEGLQLSWVGPGQPADAGGLQVGDFLLEIDGKSLERSADYDVAASVFVEGRPVVYRVRRGQRVLDLRVSPGVPVDVVRHVVYGVAMLACLGLGLLTLRQGQRVRPLWMFLFLLALELAIPFEGVGQVGLLILSWSAYYLITGAQIGVELHLASVIPDRQPWLERRPWVIPLYYVLGLGLGTLAWVTYLVEDVGGRDFFPWSYLHTDRLLDQIGLPLWAAAVVVLLILPTLRHPDRRGRLQAGLVLLGVAPWVIYVYAPLVLDLAAFEWLDGFFPLIILFFPAAVFVAIFRYHLFDIEMVVRRGLLYTALTTALVLVFYATLGAGGALLSQLVGSERHSIWVISAGTLILGALFAPMRRWLQRRIDRSLFPERQALRQRLVSLASELPSQGSVHRMGRHLVDHLSEVFGVRSAALLLNDPASGLLLMVATNPEDWSRRTSVSMLLSPQDPGIACLHQAAKPLPAADIAATSHSLAQRLDLLEAELLVPLLAEERLVGLLVLGRPVHGRPRASRAFAAEQIELLTLFAHHIAISLENVRLFESVTYEGLTGLRRREAILQVLDRELERAQRYDRPLTIGFADLDHFKRVNDRHGHLAGDALLKHVADELAAGVRSTDLVGRYGGEEFLLIFPETQLDGARVVAEKIRSRVEQLEVPVEEGVTLGMSVSIGLAALDELEDPKSGARELIAAADEALYRAKQGGRNRIEPAALWTASG